MKVLVSVLFLSFFACSSSTSGLKNVTDVSVEEAKEIMAKEEILVLDIRTSGEIADGMIPDAEFLDFYSDDFERSLSELDKEVPVLVYCKSGGRSGKAVKMMSEMGFEKIYHLKDGYNGWKAQ